MDKPYVVQSTVLPDAFYSGDAWGKRPGDWTTKKCAQRYGNPALAQLKAERLCAAGAPCEVVDLRN